MAHVTPVTPGTNIKAANASAAPAEGIDALFAALLDGVQQMPGDAAQALPPQGAANLPPANARQIAANALPQSPEKQAADNVAMQQVSAQPQIIVQPPPQPTGNTPQTLAHAMPGAPAIVTAMTAAPAVQDASSNAPAPQPPKPKDKPKSDPPPPVAAIPVFVPLPQIAALPKAASDIVSSATSKSAPIVAQQAPDHTQSAVIQTQAQAKPPAAPHEQSSPALQIAQNVSAPVKFDLSGKTGGQNAQSGNRDHHDTQSAQPAPIQSAPAQPQTNSANRNAPAPVIAASALQMPVHTNIIVQPAPQNMNAPPMAYDIGAMAITIAAKAQGDDHHFDIRLDPPELGLIAVHLTVDHTGQAAAHLTADKPETLQLLQNDSSNLQSALRDAGLNLANNNLNFSLRGDQRQAGQGFQRSNSRARNLSVSAVAAPTAISAPISSYAPGALDITI